jgi:hypothetical protein
MDYSVDIETLATSSNAVVLTIGIVVFDPNEQDTVEQLTSRALEVAVPVAPQLAAGRIIDPATLAWWFEQSDAARKSVIPAFREEIDVGSVPSVLGPIALYVSQQTQGRGCFWANPPTFDLAILDSLYSMFGLGLFVRDHRAGRDVRTLLRTVGEIHPSFDPWPSGSALTAHSAKDDAVAQALAVQRAKAALRQTA